MGDPWGGSQHGEARQADTEVKGSNRVEARQADTEVKGSNRVEARQADTEVKSSNRVEARQADTEVKGSDPTEARQADTEATASNQAGFRQADTEATASNEAGVRQGPGPPPAEEFGARPTMPSAGPTRGAPERAEIQRAAQLAAERAAGERAEAQRAAAERADAQRATRVATERAAAERAAAERAQVERAAAERGAERAEAEAEAQRAAAERAHVERAAAERAAAEAAAARVEAEQATKRAEAEAEAQRAAAARAGADADARARRRPLLTVEAEDDDEEPASGSRPTVTTQELILAGRSDSLQAALASIALRIDALTSTTSTFRNLVSDRITDYAEQVGRLAASAAGDLDDYRHLHERALEQIRRSVSEGEDNIRRLGRSVGDLDAKVGALVAAVRDSGDAVDQMTSERDQVSDTLLRGLERVEDVLSEVTAGKGAFSLSRLGDMIAAVTDERDRQEAIWTQLEGTVVALADDREHAADVLARLERAITEMTVGRERGLGKVLARLEARVDEVATAMTGLSGDDLGATLSRLDARLKEMSTELVVGRDRETAKALAQLSAQVDGIAGLVTESRPDLSPIEARLNRMARNVPQAAPVDLTEVYARLDELAEALDQPAGPDLSILQDQLDQLVHTTSPDPTWAVALQRLDRLLPALESMRTAAPARKEAGSLQDRIELMERFDQLGQQLGEQLEALRRRIPLRARPAGPALDDETIAAIADAVVARLNEGISRRPSMLPPSSPPALTRPLSPTVVDDTSPERPKRGPGPRRT